MLRAHITAQTPLLASRGLIFRSLLTHRTEWVVLLHILDILLHIKIHFSHFYLSRLQRSSSVRPSLELTVLHHCSGTWRLLYCPERGAGTSQTLYHNCTAKKNKSKQYSSPTDNSFNFLPLFYCNCWPLPNVSVIHQPTYLRCRELTLLKWVFAYQCRSVPRSRRCNLGLPVGTTC